MPDIPRMSDITPELRQELPPDGQRLLDAVLALDDKAELAQMTSDGADPYEAEEARLSEVIDPQSVYTVAMLRAAQVMADIKPFMFLTAPQEALAATWADGVEAGIEFQKRGGHQS